jgi:hypothetical protein
MASGRDLVLGRPMLGIVGVVVLTAIFVFGTNIVQINCRVGDETCLKVYATPDMAGEMEEGDVGGGLTKSLRTEVFVKRVLYHLGGMKLSNRASLLPYP